MTRQARELSNTGIYHIIIRGNERKNVFQDSEDKQRFLDGIEAKKKDSSFLLYAYCLMDNHVHLLLNTYNDNLAEIMKSIGVRYASFYNWKYHRVGHVFQDRFKSEPIEDDQYFLAVVRYIHNNPVKAGMIGNPADYGWSSFSKYIQPVSSTWLDTKFVLGLFANDHKAAVNEFVKFSMESDNIIFLDSEDGKPIRTLEEGRAYLKEYFENNLIVKEIRQIREDKQIRSEVINYLRATTGLSQRNIATLLEINKSTVERNK
ncbi:MAG TPA: transposase [Syntrophomonadaceae bacterium]|nr:transposase [Syntrophomonadaceae bacterium]